MAHVGRLLIPVPRLSFRCAAARIVLGTSHAPCWHSIVGNVQRNGLHASQQLRAVRWTPQESEKICRLRLAGLSYAEIAAQMSGRTTLAIAFQIRGLKRQDPALAERLHGADRFYDELEDKLIHEMRSSGSTWVEIAAALPKRKAGTLCSRHERSKQASNPPRSGSSWTDDEEENLLRMRHDLKLGWSKIAANLSRTSASCRNRFQMLGGQSPRRPWSHEEDTLLLETKKSGVKFKDLAGQIPGRTRDAAQMRYFMLTNNRHYVPIAERLRYDWEPEEDAILLRLKGEGQAREAIAASLPGRTADAVAARLQVLHRRAKQGSGEAKAS